MLGPIRALLAVLLAALGARLQQLAGRYRRTSRTLAAVGLATLGLALANLSIFTGIAGWMWG